MSMKILEYKCDGCDSSMKNESYTLRLESLFGQGIMGDNRMNKDKHYCTDCFNKLYSKLLTPEDSK